MSTLYIFGTPGNVGGAATKILHLVRLLHRSFEITVVPSHISFRKDKKIQRLLAELDVNFRMFNELPTVLNGIALAICELHFFSSGMARRVKERGLKIVWSNEMMWAFKGEAEAVSAGLIDRVLWVSEFQAKAFEEMYAGVSSVCTGNYIDPEDFRWKDRKNPVFTIGRLSRNDKDKYPFNFPAFYEELLPCDTCFRVMAWGSELAKRYRWHRFDKRWTFYKSDAIPSMEFIQSLDLFVYPLGHRIRESWGRSVVEAMLTGCVPLVPKGHQFHKLMRHGESGFICGPFEEWAECARELRFDYPFRMKIARASCEFAREELCAPDFHRGVWERALTF